MSSMMASRSLLNNAWYISKSGFKRGFLFLYGSRVADEGEEPLPEYELSELVIDFEGRALVIHGYSLLVDLVEYVFRRIHSNVDLSVLTREEVKKLAEIGLVNAYMSGVTLPVTRTRYVEAVIDAARENGIRIGVLAERGSLSSNPFVVLFEIDSEKLYFEDKALGNLNEVVCKPQNASSQCILVDARGYGNTLTAIEEVYMSALSIKEAYEVLTRPYRVVGLDDGYVEKGSTSDLIVYDLRNPLKASPCTSEDHLYAVIARSQQPDIVFVSGDVFFEFGENLAIPVSRVDNILIKLGEVKDKATTK